MQLTSPRGVVFTQLGEDHLTRPRLTRALQMLSLNGWVWGCEPSCRFPHRTLAIVRNEEFLAPILRLTREAAVAGGDRVAVVPRAMVEGELDMEIEDPYAGRLLANAGIIVQAVAATRIHLVGSNPELARVVNDLRYPRKRPLPRLADILVQAARGVPDRPRRITLSARDETEEVLGIYGIETREALVGGRRVHLTSSWEMRQPDGPNPVIARIGSSAGVV